MEFEKTEIRKLENCRDILVNQLLLFELDKNNKKARIDQLRDELRILNRRIEELRRNAKYYTSEPKVAPLRISTQSGCNYFVILKDSKTKVTKVDVFLQGGQDAEFMVPAGEYEIEYSAGIT